MTGSGKTPEDAAYDRLVKELGLDLIDEVATVPEEQVSETEGGSNVTELAPVTRSAEAAHLSDEEDEDLGGVKLSAELMEELKSVIGGDLVRESQETENDGSDAADVFAANAGDEEIVTGNTTSFDDDEGIGEETALDAVIFDALTEMGNGELSADDAVASDVPEAAASDEATEEEPGLKSAASQVFLAGDSFGESAPMARAPKEESHQAPLDVTEDDDIAPYVEDPMLIAEPEEDDADVPADPTETESSVFDASELLEAALSGGERRPRFNSAGLGPRSDMDTVENETAATVAPSDEPDVDFELESGLSPDQGEALDEARDKDTGFTPVLDPFDYDASEAGELVMDDDFDAGSALAEEALNAINDEANAGFDESFGDTAEGDEGFTFSSSAEGGDRLVPRISVQAFCQTESVVRSMTTMRNDRRMQNVTMDVHNGGIRGAIEFYQTNPTPHLIIVESTSAAANLLSELDELAQYCDEGVNVIVIGAANDIRLYREIINRGVAEYVVPPVDPVQLIRSVSNLFVDPEQPFIGKTIAVTGVKGGVGASTVAHNLAWSISNRLELNTTLVDLDLNFGTTGLDFNEEGAQSIADAILSPERFDEAVLERLLTKATDHLSLFTSPATLDRTYDLDVETFEHVIGLVRSSVPYIVLDLPHIWSDWFKSAVIGADEIIVVVQPELASLRNGKNLIDFLKAARPNDAPPRLVINCVGVPKRPEIPVKDFAGAIDVEPELVLPFDPQLFGTAANNGQMISDVAPESKCSQGVDYLASLMTGREMREERGSIINKLFKR